MSTEIAKIPTLQELMQETETDYNQNALQVILNQPPPKDWIKTNNNIPYLPIGRQEYLLTRIFSRWWVEVKDVKNIANSVVVSVRLFVINPITKETEWQDGCGAQPMQTKSGAGAMDWAQIQNNAVQLAAPAAESYAISDAAHKFGKIFGKDLGRKEQIDYNSILKTKVELSDIRELFLEVEDKLSPTDLEAANRILTEQETKSYTKLYNQLTKIKNK